MYLATKRKKSCPFLWRKKRRKKEKNRKWKEMMWHPIGSQTISHGVSFYPSIATIVNGLNGRWWPVIRMNGWTVARWFIYARYISPEFFVQKWMFTQVKKYKIYLRISSIYGKLKCYSKRCHLYTYIKFTICSRQRENIVVPLFKEFFCENIKVK